MQKKNDFIRYLVAFPRLPRRRRRGNEDFYGVSRRAMALRWEIMAPLGQNSWQQKQRMQAFRSMEGRWRCMRMALAGQTRAHLPQPTHWAGSTLGRDCRRKVSTGDRGVPRTKRISRRGGRFQSGRRNGVSSFGRGVSSGRRPRARAAERMGRAAGSSPMRAAQAVSSR